MHKRDEVFVLMDRTGVNRASLYVLREFANCYEVSARLELQLARSPGLNRVQKLERWTQARDWYRKSMAIWNEWESRGIGDPPSAARKIALIAELTRTEAAMSNLK